MPDWTAFWAVAGLVLVAVLVLARRTSGAAVGAEADGADSALGGERVSDRSSGADTDPDAEQPGAESSEPPNVPGPEPVGGEALPPAAVSPGLLFLNVLLTHGGLALVLLGTAALTAVPASPLGVADVAASTGLQAVAIGLGLGAALAVANAAASVAFAAAGFDPAETLRSVLAPTDGGGWALLLGGTLPLVAAFEELLFRGVLIGAAAAATGWSPWIFVLPASVAFGLGHGLQGRIGILLTTLLGVVLAAAFVLTNSLLVVVLAHYVVNAAELVVWEYLDHDPAALLADR